MPELLAQYTRMRVVSAQDARPVEANCVYVIPPGPICASVTALLYLAEPVAQGGIRMPIDFFFRALAEDRQERAVGILLSGAGSDGTLGVRAVRGAGGLTMVQDPQTAQFGDMPRSAMATELVDYVLPPDRMPGAITEYLRQPYVRGGEPATSWRPRGRPAASPKSWRSCRRRRAAISAATRRAPSCGASNAGWGCADITDLARYCGLLRGMPARSASCTRTC